jgi:hypothetical protein
MKKGLVAVPIIFIAIFLAIVLMGIQSRNVLKTLEDGIFYESGVSKLIYETEKNWSYYEDEIFTVTVGVASKVSDETKLESDVKTNVKKSIVLDVDSSHSEYVLVEYKAIDKSDTKKVNYPFKELVDISNSCCGSKTCDQCKGMFPNHLFTCNGNRLLSVGKESTSSEFLHHDMLIHGC